MLLYCPISICKRSEQSNSDVVMKASLLGQCQLSEESEVGGERLVMATEGSSDRIVQTNDYDNSGVQFHPEV